MRMLSGKVKNITGDVILAAAYITFLSGFTKRYRARLIDMWIQLLLTTDFYVSSPNKYSLVELFADSVKVKSWTST